MAVGGPCEEVDIDRERFELLKRARRALIEAFALEEKYEILVSNYLELEQQVVRQAAVAQVRTQGDCAEIFDFRIVFNVALVNLLTASRLYVEQFPRHVRECLADDSKLELAESWRSQAYDSAFEYRFMEALRNHVQHNGVPLHRWNVNANRTEEGFVEFKVSLFSEKKYLVEDASFKKPVLAECSERVDLLSSARVYMHSLSEVHSKAREAINDVVAMSRSAVEKEQERYRSSSPDAEASLRGLEAQAVDGEHTVERVPLFLECDDVRKKLQTRNRLLRDLPISFESSRVG